jgi:hypothetical protein
LIRVNPATTHLQCVAYGTSHLDRLRRPEVYAQIKRWLAGSA